MQNCYFSLGGLTKPTKSDIKRSVTFNFYWQDPLDALIWIQKKQPAAGKAQSRPLTLTDQQASTLQQKSAFTPRIPRPASKQPAT